MFSMKSATPPSTPDAPARTRGRRAELPDPATTFTLSRPPGWGSQVNHAALALSAACFVAPQIILYPAVLISMPAAVFVISRIATKAAHETSDRFRLRRWASKHLGVQLDTDDAIQLLDGGATATHAATLHGHHFHVSAIEAQAPAVSAIKGADGAPGNPVPVVA